METLPKVPLLKKIRSPECQGSEGNKTNMNASMKVKKVMSESPSISKDLLMRISCHGEDQVFEAASWKISTPSFLKSTRPSVPGIGLAGHGRLSTRISSTSLENCPSLQGNGRTSFSHDLSALTGSLTDTSTIPLQARSQKELEC